LHPREQERLRASAMRVEELACDGATALSLVLRIRRAWLLEVGDRELRIAGLGSMLIGVAILFLSRG